MVTARKKSYMRFYNQLPHVKVAKAAYMRKIRAEQNKEAAHNLVKTLLNFGYDNLAFEYAQERAPEMLVTAKAGSRKK